MILPSMCDRVERAAVQPRVAGMIDPGDVARGSFMWRKCHESGYLPPTRCRSGRCASSPTGTDGRRRTRRPSNTRRSARSRRATAESSASGSRRSPHGCRGRAPRPRAACTGFTAAIVGTFDRMRAVGHELDDAADEDGDEREHRELHGRASSARCHGRRRGRLTARRSGGASRILVAHERALPRGALEVVDGDERARSVKSEPPTARSAVHRHDAHDGLEEVAVAQHAVGRELPPHQALRDAARCTSGWRRTGCRASRARSARWRAASSGASCRRGAGRASRASRTPGRRSSPARRGARGR